MGLQFFPQQLFARVRVHAVAGRAGALRVLVITQPVAVQDDADSAPLLLGVLRVPAGVAAAQQRGGRGQQRQAAEHHQQRGLHLRL